MKRLTGTLLVVAAGIAVGSGYAKQAQAEFKVHKSAVCHGTASAKNPYVLIIVDDNSLVAHRNGVQHGRNSAPDYVLGQIFSKEDEQRFRAAGDDACTGGGGDGGGS
ncbi:MAG: hypothetical protein JWN98_1049 [Abditibacteriota bacterium]|nr:hypothetical protein [Abditibacteriota bacterium]